MAVDVCAGTRLDTTPAAPECAPRRQTEPRGAARASRSKRPTTPRRLVAEVESLRVKLAAAEQERDHWRAAIAAVREWAVVNADEAPSLDWASLVRVLDSANRSADPPAAEREGDEPKQHCVTLDHKNVPATVTGTLWEGDDPEDGIRTAYCDECSKTLYDAGVFTPDPSKQEEEKMAKPQISDESVEAARSAIATASVAASAMLLAQRAIAAALPYLRADIERQVREHIAEEITRGKIW